MISTTTTMMATTRKTTKMKTGIAKSKVQMRPSHKQEKQAVTMKNKVTVTETLESPPAQVHPLLRWRMEKRKRTRKRKRTGRHMGIVVMQVLNFLEVLV